jgi:hypothetical protein
MTWLICVFIGHAGARFATAGGYICRRCGRKAHF